ncbi:hypothetical protein ACSF6V_10085 [Escherichia coli]|uniref:hypothetical protein n=1 Tax=Escherichia coli TaxID=562 RepID=UPI003EEA6BE6
MMDELSAAHEAGTAIEGEQHHENEHNHHHHALAAAFVPGVEFVPEKTVMALLLQALWGCGPFSVYDDREGAALGTAVGACRDGLKLVEKVLVFPVPMRRQRCSIWRRPVPG